MGPSRLFCGGCRRFFNADGTEKGAEHAERDVVILQKQVAGLSEAALARFVLRAKRAAGLRGSVNVLVTRGADLRSLNRQFRGKNKATDVLSFPVSASRSRRTPRLAGDIAISADIAARNARQLGHSTAEEVQILALHGILHLAGFDHERDNGAMARKELELRRKLRLPVGLIERTKPKRESLTHGGRKPRGSGVRRTA
jgi:probable rRNA maturation factor